jgi:hypothetical protein
VLLAGEALAQGHDHTLSVGITIGPLVLRVALLAAVPVVAGFAMLRAVVPESRRTTATVAGCSAAMVVLTLMLAGGTDIPAQAVVVVLAALAGPLVVILKRVERLRAFAPWVLTVAGVGAAVEFGRAWLVPLAADDVPVVLYTGVVLALVGLSWFTVCVPRRRLFRVVTHVQAVVLALALVGGTAQATVLRLAGPPPAAAPPGHCPLQTPSSAAASAVPSTRALILANAVSREVDVSSENGENPQSSHVPS